MMIILHFCNFVIAKCSWECVVEKYIIFDRIFSKRKETAGSRTKYKMQFVKRKAEKYFHRRGKKVRGSRFLWHNIRAQKSIHLRYMLHYLRLLLCHFHDGNPPFRLLTFFIVQKLQSKIQSFIIRNP